MPRAKGEMPMDTIIKDYLQMSDAEKENLRIKLTFSKELALRTGQKLFGFTQKGTFTCPLCGNDEPGVACEYFMLKTYYECSQCGYKGNLFNFQSEKNGRKRASRDDFLTVDAVSAVADRELLTESSEIDGQQYYPPAVYAEWLKTEEHTLSMEKERRSLELFLQDKGNPARCGTYSSDPNFKRNQESLRAIGLTDNFV